MYLTHSGQLMGQLIVFSRGEAKMRLERGVEASSSVSTHRVMIKVTQSLRLNVCRMRAACVGEKACAVSGFVCVCVCGLHVYPCVLRPPERGWIRSWHSLLG
jgi:hypothetical protein